MKNFLIVLSLFIISCSTDNAREFNIEGNVYGLKSRDLIYAKVVNGAPVYLDTISVSSENFNFDTENLNQEDFRFLIPIYDQKKFIKIFIDNSDIQVSGNIDSIQGIKITGSKSHSLFDGLMKDYGLIEKESKVINLQLQLALMDNDTIESQELETELFDSEKRKSALFLDFSKEHPNSDLSAWALLQILAYSDYNTLKKIAENFTDKVKASSFYTDLDFILTEMAKTAIGADAPQFSLPKINGEQVKLSSYKGKVVLLDFWSPLCEYCRLSNPKMEKLHQKYKEKGLVVIGVNSAPEDGLDIWKLVVEQDKLTYLQLIDSLGVADDYKVSSTPYTILIDENQKIIGKNIHDIELEEALRELFK